MNILEIEKIKINTISLKVKLLKSSNNGEFLIF